MSGVQFPNLPLAVAGALAGRTAETTRTRGEQSQAVAREALDDSLDAELSDVGSTLETGDRDADGRMDWTAPRPRRQAISDDGTEQTDVPPPGSQLDLSA